MMGVIILSYKRKYRPGGRISSMDELIKQEFIYCNGKILHNSWVKSWPVRLASSYIEWGSLRYAVKNETEEKTDG